MGLQDCAVKRSVFFLVFRCDKLIHFLDVFWAKSALKNLNTINHILSTDQKRQEILL